MQPAVILFEWDSFWITEQPTNEHHTLLESFDWLTLKSGKINKKKFNNIC